MTTVSVVRCVVLGLAVLAFNVVGCGGNTDLTGAPGTDVPASPGTESPVSPPADADPSTRRLHFYLDHMPLLHHEPDATPIPWGRPNGNYWVQVSGTAYQVHAHDGSAQAALLGPAAEIGYASAPSHYADITNLPNNRPIRFAVMDYPTGSAPQTGYLGACRNVSKTDTPEYPLVLVGIYIDLWDATGANTPVWRAAQPELPAACTASFPNVFQFGRSKENPGLIAYSSFDIPAAYAYHHPDFTKRPPCPKKTKQSPPACSPDTPSSGGTGGSGGAGFPPPCHTDTSSSGGTGGSGGTSFPPPPCHAEFVGPDGTDLTPAVKATVQMAHLICSDAAFAVSAAFRKAFHVTSATTLPSRAWYTCEQLNCPKRVGGKVVGTEQCPAITKKSKDGSQDIEIAAKSLQFSKTFMTTATPLAKLLSSGLTSTKNTASLQGWTFSNRTAALPATASHGTSSSLDAADTGGVTYKLASTSSGYGVGWSLEEESAESASVTVTNDYQLYRQISVAYNNGPTTGTPTFVTLLKAPDTILGIPIETPEVEVPLEFPADATSATITVGSLGAHGPYDPNLAGFGVVTTLVFNLGIPGYFLLSGLGELPSTLKELALDLGKEELAELLEFFFVLISSLNDSPAGSEVLEDLGTSFEAFLFDAALGGFLLELQAQVLAVYGGEELADNAPFIGWVLRLVSIAADVALITETVVDFALSPWQVTNTVNRTQDIAVTAMVAGTCTPPDHVDGCFSPDADSYRIDLSFTEGDGTSFTGELSGTQTGSVSHTFSDQLAGGDVSVAFVLLDSSGVHPVIVGKGSLGSTENLAPESSALELSVPVTNLPFPLGPDTAYEYRLTLDVDATSGDLVWEAASTPPPGDPRLVPEIDSWGTLSLSQQPGRLTSTWSSQVQAHDPCSTASAGNDGFFAGTFIPFADFLKKTPATAPATASAYIACPEADGIVVASKAIQKTPASAGVATPGSAATSNLAIIRDPADATTMLVVPLSLANDGSDAAAPYGLNADQAYLRFPSSLEVTDAVWHPQDYLVAIGTGSGKLILGALGTLYDKDNGIPQAQVGGGTTLDQHAVNNTFMTKPRGITMGRQQSVIVLDDTGSITPGTATFRAFGPHGTPVQAFCKDATPPKDGAPCANPSSSLPLTNLSLASSFGEAAAPELKFWGLASDVMGYLFVLYSVASPETTEDFALNVYDPTGAFVLTTHGLAAATLEVDLWRNIYTQDFQAMKTEGRVQPTISLWQPEVVSE